MDETDQLDLLVAAVVRDEANVRSAARNAIASFEGQLERLDGERIEGWARDAFEICRNVSVDILDAGRLVITVATDIWRADLKTSAGGNSRCGFSVPTPQELKDGAEHLIDAFVTGTGYRLAGSPRRLVAP